jgi:hypothetical protein
VFDPLPLLGPAVLALTYLGLRWTSTRRLRRMQNALFGQLRSGASLDTVEQLLARAVADAVDWRLNNARGRKSSARSLVVERDLRALHAVAAMESLHFDVAREELEALLGHVAYELLILRLALIRGIADPDGPSPIPSVHLDESLFDDTRAQLALFRGEGAMALAEGKPVYPGTRARLLAAAGREEEALALLRTLAPTRLADLRRAFPADAAVLAFARDEQRSPYR